MPILQRIDTKRALSFEAAEASVAIMLKRQEYGYKPPFELIDFFVNVEHRQGRGIFAEDGQGAGTG
jgi:2-isopropylmalate synthase